MEMTAVRDLENMLLGLADWSDGRPSADLSAESLAGILDWLKERADARLEKKQRRAIAALR